VADRGACAAKGASAADRNPDAFSEQRRCISSPRSGVSAGIGKAGLVRGHERPIRRALVHGQYGCGAVDATSLVNLNPDVIVIVGDRVIPVFMALTRSIPIVVAITSDPIASGAVESLARPGRNVTGFSLIEFSIFGKMLETLKGLAPGISPVRMMYNPDNPVGAAYLRAFEMGTDFCLIFAPCKGYDEPEILPSSTHPICLTSADGGQAGDDQMHISLRVCPRTS
jgi:ABC transporter substrate binding protein